MTKLMGLGSGGVKLAFGYNDLVAQASFNTGNLVFNYALENCVSLIPPRFRWSSPAESINQYDEPLLIPMANNIGPHTNLWEKGPQLADVNVPVVVVGIGAQFSLGQDFESAFSSIPEGTLNWLKATAAKSPCANFSVRGDLTKKIFERIGLGEKAVALGCPSHFLNPNRKLGETLAAKSGKLISRNLNKGIVVAGGNYSVKNLGRLEQYLIMLINTCGGRYIVQHPANMIKLTQGWHSEVPQSDITCIREQFFPSLTDETMFQWLNKNASTYISVPQWHLDISRYALALGTRIHGIQMALQAGVPAVCLYIDSRTKELCDTMKIPSIEAKAFQKSPSLDWIFDVLHEWPWQEYDVTRMTLAKSTAQFLTDNNLLLQSAFKKFSDA